MGGVHAAPLAWALRFLSCILRALLIRLSGSCAHTHNVLCPHVAACMHAGSCRQSLSHSCCRPLSSPDRSVAAARLGPGHAGLEVHLLPRGRLVLVLLRIEGGLAGALGAGARALVCLGGLVQPLHACWSVPQRLQQA